MLITTRSPLRFASSTRVRWPSCRAPIVGTNAIRSRSIRALEAVAIIFSTVSMERILEAVCRVRVSAAADLSRERSDCFSNFLSELGVPLEKPGRESVIQPEQVGQDEDLAVAIRPSADSDRRNLQRLSDSAGDRRGNELED